MPNLHASPTVRKHAAREARRAHPCVEPGCGRMVSYHAKRCVEHAGINHRRRVSRACPENLALLTPSPALFGDFPSWIKATITECQTDIREFSAWTGIGVKTIESWFRTPPQFVKEITAARLESVLCVSRAEIDRLLLDRSEVRSEAIARGVATKRQRYGDDYFQKQGTAAQATRKGMPRSEEERANIKAGRWSATGWGRKRKKEAASAALSKPRKSPSPEASARQRTERWQAGQVLDKFRRRTLLDEYQITRLYAEGHPRKAIARRMHTSKYIVGVNLAWYGLIPLPKGCKSREEVESELRWARTILYPGLEAGREKGQRSQAEEARERCITTRDSLLADGKAPTIAAMVKRSCELRDQGVLKTGLGHETAKAFIDSQAAAGAPVDTR